jgi:ParB-like chromosome segregation protein Spo0J
VTKEIPLGLIRPFPDNARKTFSRVPELAATIEGLGLLQNLVVVKLR